MRDIQLITEFADASC